MPLRAQDFRTRYRQATAWIEDYQPTVRQVLVLGVNQWADRFDAEPTVLPAELDFPPDLPRITIPSSDRIWRVEVALRRVNVIWEDVAGKTEIPPGEFSRIAGGVLEPFLNLDPALRIVRLAFVIRRFTQHDNSARELASFFARDELLRGPLNRPEAFELHAYKAYDPAVGLPRVNSWIRWKAGRTSGANINVVAVEQDLNTLAEPAPGVRFQFDETRRFFERATEEVDDILQRYLAARVPSGMEGQVAADR